jgi:CheY-like chemotaxis protein
VEAYKRAHRPNIDTGTPSTGNTAVAIPEGATRPAVCLMDVNMPNLNGYEATRLIREFEQETGTRPATIVALTGLGNKMAQEKSFEVGMDLFLTKPVRLKELGALLSKIRGAANEIASEPA